MVGHVDEQHPTASQLQNWLSGEELDNELIASIEGHVSHCTVCASFLSKMEMGEVERQVRTVAGPLQDGGAVRLSEGYELAEVVGQGGSGTVYRAAHHGLGRTVAVKMLNSGRHTSPAALARFAREAKALARLNHPNVVRVFDVGEQDGTPYLALEWITGPTLRQFLRDVTLTDKLAARIVAALAAGVEHAHEHGILHRDLKPDNVLVVLTPRSDENAEHRSQLPLRHYQEVDVDFDRAESFKVVDFGLARVPQDEQFQTRSGEILGTPAYMAPEQVQASHDQLDVRTDVYGLGAILYECLTGRPPLQGNTAAETIRLVVEQDPVAISSLRPGASRDLAVICHRCLAKSPLARFASASDLRDDLQRFLNGQPIASRPVSGLERSLKWARKNPWPIAAGLALALALVATFVGQAYYQRSLAGQRDLALENYRAARTAIWEMVDAALAESAFDVPRLQQLQLAQLSTAETLFEQLAAQEQTSTAYRDLAQVRIRYGSALIVKGDLDQGRKLLKQARQVFSELSAESTDDADLIGQLIEAQVKQACVLNAAERSSEARQLLEATLPLAEDLHRRSPNNLEQTDLLAWTLHNLGCVIDKRQDRQSAMEAFQAAVELRTQALRQSPDNLELLRFLAESQLSLAGVRMAVDVRAAEKDNRQAIKTLQELLHHDPKDMTATISLAVAFMNLSNMLAAQISSADDAIQACDEGIRLLEQALAATPDQRDAQRYLAMLYGNRAMFGSQTGHTRAAIADWKEAIAATNDAAIQEFCQLQLIRDLATICQIQEAVSEAQQLAAKPLKPDTRLKLVLAYGVILNACFSTNESTSVLGADSIRNEVIKAIQEALDRLAVEGDLVDDPSTRNLLANSQELARFRVEVGPGYLENLFRR